MSVEEGAIVLIGFGPDKYLVLKTDGLQAKIRCLRTGWETWIGNHELYPVASRTDPR